MTLILETTLPAVREYAKRQAVAHFEKGQFLDSPNEEVQKWLDTRDISPEVGEFDQIYDAYCEGFRSYHVERWIAGLTLDQAADLRQRLANRTETAPPASSVVPAPLVPDVVKGAVEALEMALRYWKDYAEVDEGEDLWISLHREADDFRSAQYALSALRLLTAEPEGAPKELHPPAQALPPQEADVPPLGEIEHPHYAGGEQILFDDEFGNGGLLAGGTENIYVDRLGGPPPQFNRQQAHSLIAHLQAWLSTGSFALPSAPQGGEMKGYPSYTCKCHGCGHIHQWADRGHKEWGAATCCPKCGGVEYTQGFFTLTGGASVPTGGHADNGDSKAAASKEPSSEDKELLDWLEAQSKASRTGISFDYVRYVEDGQVLEKGYRFMRRHFLGERRDTLREAIRSAKAQDPQEASTTPQKEGK